jgi:hypothetical protein
VFERIAISSSESSEPSFKFAIPAIEIGTLKSYLAMIIFSVMEVSGWKARLDDLSTVMPGPQYFADQLTLFEPGRADYPHLLLLAPNVFHLPASLK